MSTSLTRSLISREVSKRVAHGGIADFTLGIYDHDSKGEMFCVWCDCDRRGGDYTLSLCDGSA